MAVDCRNCSHCVKVTEGVSIDCDDGGSVDSVRWDTATGSSNCSGFERKSDGSRFRAHANCAKVSLAECDEFATCVECAAAHGPEAQAASAEGHGEDNVEAGTKDTNPKDVIGSTKLPLSLVPPLTVAYASIAHLNGALKYGKGNWRKAGVRASIYADAAKRHIDSWLDGEEVDPEDGVPHLSAVLACIGIILDSRACGKLTDDRMMRNPGYRAEVAQLTAHVKRLQELHKDKQPRHFTIADSEAA
jgi:hypothetical protein